MILPVRQLTSTSPHPLLRSFHTAKYYSGAPGLIRRGDMAVLIVKPSCFTRA